MREKILESGLKSLIDMIGQPVSKNAQLVLEDAYFRGAMSVRIALNMAASQRDVLREIIYVANNLEISIDEFIERLERVRH